jgi:hypothetical protein
MHEGFGVKPRTHIPGMVVHDYLKEYADKFGITPNIRYSSTALSAEKLDDCRWKLEVNVAKTESSEENRHILLCDKLIVATGLTSQPVNRPGLWIDAHRLILLGSREILRRGQIRCTSDQFRSSCYHWT